MTKEHVCPTCKVVILSDTVFTGTSCFPYCSYICSTGYKKPIIPEILDSYEDEAHDA